jgi:magnesium chelatase family protein
MGAIASVKVCDIDVLAVAWTLADLAGLTSPGVEEVSTALSFRQGGNVR